MACCGGGGRKPAPRILSQNKAFKVAGGEGLTLLRYVGKAELPQTFYGPVTGAQYAAGRARPVVAVDNRDLYGPDQKRVGMLERIEHGKNIFVREPLPPRPVPKEVGVPVEVAAVETAVAAEAPADTMVIDWRDSGPNPDDLSLSEIKKLELEPEDWAVLADKEKAGKARKSVIEFAQGKAA